LAKFQKASEVATINTLNGVKPYLTIGSKSVLVS